MCARITVDYRRHKSLCVHEWVIHVCGCARVQQRSIVTRAIHHSVSWSIAHTGFIPVYKFPFSWSLYLYSCWDSHHPPSRCWAQTQGSDEKCIDANITTMAWFAMLTSFLIENWTFLSILFTIDSVLFIICNSLGLAVILDGCVFSTKLVLHYGIFFSVKNTCSVVLESSTTR